MKDENIPIGALLKQCLTHWKIYVPIGLLCLAGAILFILITPKQYEFTARMQLVEKERSMMSELRMLTGSGLGALLGASTSGNSVEDEVAILMSRTNLADAIRATDYQVESRTWRGLKRTLLYGDELPVRYVFPAGLLDTLSESIKLKVSLRSDGGVRVKAKSKLFSTVKLEAPSLPCRLELPVGVIELLPNTDSQGVAMDFTTCITPLQKVFEDMYDDLYAGAQETVSDIILLRMDNEHKQRGRDILDAAMRNFNRYARSVKQQETDLNADFIRERLDSITVELAYLEHAIEQYKKQNELVDPALYTKSAMTGKQELESNILETEVRLKMMDYVVAYLDNPRNRYASVPAIEGVAEESIALYNQLLLQRQRLMQSAGAENPTLQLTNRQIEEQQKMLRETIDAARQSLRASLRAIDQKNRTVDSRLGSLPTQEREYIELKRQQKIKETVYLFLMQKLQEKELANAPDEQAARVIDPAYCSAKPVFPRKSIVLAVAFLVACFVSLGVIGYRILVCEKK